MKTFILIYVACEAILFGAVVFWNESLLGQILFLSQLPTLILLAPFVMRSEVTIHPPLHWRTNLIAIILIVLLIVPYLLATGGWSQASDWVTNGAGVIQKSKEAFVVLGFCLCTMFILAALILKRSYR